MPDDIPGKYLQFCAEVGRLCKEAGLRDFSGSFNPDSFIDKGCDWRNRIEFNWSQGRHGSMSDRIFIKSTQDVSCSITGPAPYAGDIEKE